MAEAAKKVEQMPNTRSNDQVYIKGKLDRVTIFGQKNQLFQNIILVAADEEYGYPKKFCVNTRSRLGAEGDIVTVIPEVVCKSRQHEGKWYYSHELWAD